MDSRIHLECVFVLQQSADGDAQTLTEVDLFISTQRIKVLNADSQVSLLLRLITAEGLKLFTATKHKCVTTNSSSDDNRLCL